ncbi:hypothetical protein SAMN03159358_0238 [Paenibacillus sp. NFR01]|nr:hypothetical protein SAMN03159358_0238 [Paenibacillus sp. NFR01]
MAIKHETELYAPLKRFFEGRGYTVKGEVRTCDLVGVREGEEEPLIVELKKTFNLALLLQGVERLRLSPNVYLAVERSRDKKGAVNQRWGELTGLCRRLGLGLITVMFYKTKTPLVEVLAEPGAAPPQARGGQRRRERLLREFGGRSGDYNTGGSTRVKLVTAYREKALRVALALRAAELEAGGASGKAVQEELARALRADAERLAPGAAGGKGRERALHANAGLLEPGVAGSEELARALRADAERLAPGAAGGKEREKALRADAGLLEPGVAGGEERGRWLADELGSEDWLLLEMEEAPPGALSSEAWDWPDVSGQDMLPAATLVPRAEVNPAEPGLTVAETAAGYAAAGVSPAELRRRSGVPDAAAILQRNYYGWFTRVNRGRYTLSRAGAAALDEYAAIAGLAAGKA